MIRGRIAGILCAAVFLAGILGCAWILRPKEGAIVEIVRDGVVYCTLDLAQTEDQTLELSSPNGTNAIQIQDGAIRVLSADCPDQTCVRMGALSPNGLPIVCLPHHLVIQFTQPATDGAAG